MASRRSRIVAAVVAVLIVAGLALAIAAGGSSSVSVRSQMIDGTPEGSTPVKIDTSLYLPSSTPAPAVLLTQGFGGDKSALDATARTYAQSGYVVLTYTARGFGKSGGLIHFASPDYEIKDAEKLVTYLSSLPQVKKVGGKPQIAAAGSSYGGGISLLLAAADHRVDAVAADITWNSLSQALFPNFASTGGPGVYKKLYAGVLFGYGLDNEQPPNLPGVTPIAGSSSDTAPSSSVGCGRYAPDICSAFQQSAQLGTPTAALTRLMNQASPASVITKIDAPTVLTQGVQDSLFPLTQADANAKGIAANGTPVRVVWRQGGHDTGTGTDAATSEAISWFGSVFGSGVGTSQPWRFSEQAGVVSASTGDVAEETLQAPGYPGVDGTKATSQTVTLSGGAQTVSSPAGGAPAVITSIPGLGGISSRLDQLLALGPSAPGQTAYFDSPKLTGSLRVGGAPTVRLSITSSSSDAQLFLGLRDVGTDGTSTLPSQLVSPIRLTGLTPNRPQIVTVALPSIVRNILPGHRLLLTASTTDFSYANPQDARTYRISLVDGTLTVPTATGTTINAGHPVIWLIVGLIVALLVLLTVTGILLRRRLVLKSRPDLADVPVAITGLIKEYKGGYRAVDDITFRVERGQVVGLLGPNGAGKTTALRVLTGLITPTAGTVHVFGEPVVPGASVLSRLGSFIEGPGFLPHLSGRENLRLYWAATGRPKEEADFDTALEIAGLGKSVDRRVRAYSQGMRQRLGIAQAMLGLPEVLVLDEPTNGLDPPQIAEMREVLQDYARTGRTVVVSSHLLSEVEQTCTDVVVMHRGRLVASGSVAEIAGAGGVQLAVPDPAEATRVLAAAGITADSVPARRALEDVFLGLIGDSDE